MAVHGEEVTGEGRRVPTTHTPRQLYRREFPQEPYPTISMSAAVLLGGATMLFLFFFGMSLIGSPLLPSILLALLSALAVAMPLIGIRALFGSHPYSILTLTALGVLFLIGGYAAELLVGTTLVTAAIGPALLVLGVAGFAWWKWATKSRHVDWGIDN